MKDAAFAKFVVLVNGLVPLALLCWDAWNHQLGTNPQEFAIRTTGMTALVFLMLTLAVTPVRKITGWNFLSNFRRLLGLFAFFYGCVHLFIYFGLYQSFSIGAVAADSLKRPFIFFGMTALLVMLPLAATSTNGIIKKMGAKRWKQLHKLVYVAGIAGVLHYFYLVKADERKPLAFAAVLAVLLGYRIAKGLSPAARPVAPARA
ncbi:MAG: protein-methionine-sulfoxide reductase heme-binding subunit MsrQ [Tepidisphaeraceae bacterium]